jgi:catechol 2,3-dioxygenase-like lactoylglutathione lyase family enzyme
MPVLLDHLIVPSKDRIAAARKLAGILDVPWAEQGKVGPFSPVYVSNNLTLDFDQWTEPLPKLHFCFRVDPHEFSAILSRLKAAKVPYRSTPHGRVDSTVNSAFGGSIVYWNEPDDHVWELLTVSYERQ